MKTLFFLIVFAITFSGFSQSNTYPASGNVGIGTLSPTEKLSVIGNVIASGSYSGKNNINLLSFNNGDLPFINFANSDGSYNWARIRGGLLGNGNGYMSLQTKFGADLQEQVRILDNGNFGIGTLNPKAKLDVLGPAYFNNVAGQDYAAIAIGASGGGYGTIGYGYRFTNTNYQYTYANADYASLIHFNLGGMQFKTAPVGSTGGTINFTDAMVLLQNGNVGIGTPAPNYALDVAASVSGAVVGRLYGHNGSTSDNVQLRFAGQKDGELWAIGSDIASGGSTGDFEFYNLGNAGGSTGTKMTILGSGNVGIGTTNPTEKLAVNGNIRAKKLIVTQNGWPDYVFSRSYKLRPITEVANYIAINKHLPDMPSAKDVEEKGLDIGKTQAALLKKIEELTLYIISLENRLSKIEKKNKVN